MHFRRYSIRYAGIEVKPNIKTIIVTLCSRTGVACVTTFTIGNICS